MRVKANCAAALSLLFIAGAVATADPLQKGDLVDTRVGPENFSDRGATPFGCFDQPTEIPDFDPQGVTTSLLVDKNCIQSINIEFHFQATHTWVGDLTVTLTKVGGPSAVLIDRPGVPATDFGCDGDDYDVVIDDGGLPPLEDECGPGVPSIDGLLLGGDPPADLMQTFYGENQCGEWQVTVVDHAGGDTGTINEWCIFVPITDGGDGPDVPASSRTGALLMVGVVLGLLLLFHRRNLVAS